MKLIVVREDRLREHIAGGTWVDTNQATWSVEKWLAYLTEGIPEGLLEEMANMLDDAEYALRAHIRPNESIANSVRNGVRTLLARYRQAGEGKALKDYRFPKLGTGYPLRKAREQMGEGKE